VAYSHYAQPKLLVSENRIGLATPQHSLDVWRSPLRKNVYRSEPAANRIFRLHATCRPQDLSHPLEIFARISEGRVALDEINRLVDPTGLLKLLSEHFPGITTIATSSAPASLVLSEKEHVGLNMGESGSRQWLRRI